MSAFTRFLDLIGLSDLETRHKEWRNQQISLELEELQTECAQLAAHIGRLQAEKAQLEQELNRDCA
jgi:predicted nuclease with TOPRIM domain